MSGNIHPKETRLLRGQLKCPKCLMNLSGFTHWEDDSNRPTPGDFSVCFHCGAMLRFGDGLLYYELAKEEDLKELNPKQRKVVEVMRKTFKKKKPW